MLLLSAFIPAGCDNDDDHDRQIEMPNQSEQIQMGYADDETTGGFTFTAKSAWTATVTEAATGPANRSEMHETRSSSVSWLRLLYNGEVKYAGEAGTFTLVIELETNRTGQTRSATVTIESGGDKITVSVTQEGTNKDGTVPEEPKSPYGGSGTFTYTLHDGFSFTFEADGATFKDNRLNFYNDGAMIDLYADFYLPENSPLSEGIYEFNGRNTDANSFTTTKGYIGEYVWYGVDKGVIEVSIDGDIYTVRYLLYISTDGSLDYQGEIEGAYTGYLPENKE